MKRTSKFFLMSVVVVLAVCLMVGMTTSVAFAETETPSREFDDRFDTSFEEFGALTNDITATGLTLEKPYLHVEFTAADSGTPDDPIFKEGKGMDSASVGSIVFRMRAPKGDVELSELMFGSRFGDKYEVYGKSFADLRDANGDPLPELATTWQNYVINYAQSYQDYEVYNNDTGTPSEVKVNEGKIVGVHLFAAAEAEGTIEIDKVYKTTDTDGNEETDAAASLINDFTGGKTVSDTMNGGWWAGSSKGYIVQPNILKPNTTLTVKHTNNAAGEYQYAVIDATGDVENLKVSFAGENGSFGTSATVYSGKVIEVSPETCQFKFEYSGEETAQVDRIFYTNLEVPATTSDPLPDLANAKVLDDFSLAQATVSGDYGEAIDMPGLAEAGLFFRLCFSNDKNVKVENGAAVFEAATDYISLKIRAREAVAAKYVLLKMKVENGATLDNFRFTLAAGDNAQSPVFYNDLMRDSTRKVNALKESTLYTGGEWDYLIVDIAESKLYTAGAAVDTIELYWTGTDRLYIDEILLADDLYNETSIKKVEEISKETPFTFTPNPSEGGYKQAAQWTLNNADMKGNVLALEITKLDDSTNFDDLRLGFDSSLVIWGGGEHNDPGNGMIILTNGLKFSDVTFETNVPQTVYIDLVASGITSADTCYVHTSNTATGPFQVTRVEVLKRAVATEDINEEEYFGFEDEVKVEADTTGDYTYVGYAGSLSNAQGKYLSVTVEAGEKDVDLTNVRFEFTAGGGVRWFGENAEGRLLDKDGNPFADLTVEANTSATFLIDLEKSGVKPGDFHIHANAINQVTFKNIKIYKTAYEIYLEANDKTAPDITITAPETATKGAQIEVQAAAKDNAYARATYQVSVKLGEEDIALAEGKFTAEKVGTYTVTVTAQDAFGNTTTQTKQIVVAEEQQPSEQQPGEQQPGEKEPENKTNVGAIVGGVVGGVAGAALIVAVVLIVLKKKKGAKKAE